MKATTLRHAAALALVGWYLMVPPLPGKERSDLQQDFTPGPVSTWKIIQRFDSAVCCEQKLENERRSVLNDPVETSLPALLTMWQNAACIETVDPRLKPN